MFDRLMTVLELALLGVIVCSRRTVMTKQASITRRVERWYSKAMSRILVWAVFFQIRSRLSLVNDPRISNFSLGQLAEVLDVPETTSPSELIKAFHRGARFWRVEPNDLFQAFYTRANRPSAVGYGQTQNSIWDYRTRTNSIFDGKKKS